MLTKKKDGRLVANYVNSLLDNPVQHSPVKLPFNVYSEGASVALMVLRIAA